MTDIMASLIVNVHAYKATQTSFRDGKWFLNASMVSAYPLRQMLLSVVADGSTR